MYICIMLRYKKGDIVICVTNKMYGMKYLLEVGEQYKIDDCIEMATTDGKLDAEQALTNMIERDFAIEFNKEVIEGLKNLGTDEQS